MYEDLSSDVRLDDHHTHLKKTCDTKLVAGGAHLPLISALVWGVGPWGRGAVDLCEFQDSQGYTQRDKPCLKKLK